MENTLAGALYFLRKTLLNPYFYSSFIFFMFYKNLLLAVHEGWGHPSLFAATFSNGRSETLLGHFDEFRYCPSVRNLVRTLLMHYTGGVVYFPCHRVIHDEFQCANGTMQLTSFGHWLTETRPLGFGFARWLNMWGSATEVTFSIALFWVISFLLPHVRTPFFVKRFLAYVDTQSAVVRCLLLAIAIPVRLFVDVRFFLKTFFYVAGFSFVWAPNHYLQRCLLHGHRCGDYGAFEMWQGEIMLLVYHVTFWSILGIYLLLRANRRRNQVQRPEVLFVVKKSLRKKIVRCLDSLASTYATNKDKGILDMVAHDKRFQVDFEYLLRLFCEEAQLSISKSVRFEQVFHVSEESHEIGRIKDLWNSVASILNSWNKDKKEIALKNIFYRDSLPRTLKTLGVATTSEAWVDRGDRYLFWKQGLGGVALGYAVWILFVFGLNKAVEETAGMVSDYSYFKEFECPYSIPYTTVEQWIMTLPANDTNH